MAVGKGLSSRLRGRVAVERPNLVDNGRGGRKVPADGPAWLPVATSVPAEIIAMRGDEATQSLVVRSKQLWRVVIRPRAGISTGLRIVWRDRFLGEIIGNIRSAAPNPAGDELVMTVESEAKSAV